MDLSPNDIRNYEFQSQLRGYEKEAVESVLEQVANELEELKQANLKLSMELDSVQNQFNGLKQFEDTIKSAAIDARRNADMTMENAKKEAEELLEDAKTKAEKSITENSNKVHEIENQLSQLDLTKRSYITKLRGLIQSHLEIVDEIAEAELPKEVNLTANDSDKIEVTDSSEVEAKIRENISTVPSNIEGVDAEESTVSDPLIEAEKAANNDESEVDPELEAAIKGFRSNDDSESDQQQSSEPVAETKTDPQTGWVETDRKAEDVPPEFITGSEVNEHNEQPAQNQEAPPEDLGIELDRVAAKFEEEMDKADKS